MAQRKLGSTKSTDTLIITSVDLTADVVGNLPVTNLNSGTLASGTTFWCGDGTWKAPSGSGTVNTGTQYDLAYYATSTTAVSPLTTANSGVLVTDSGGVPSIATDIPTAVTIGGAYIYRAGGTTVVVADGGTNLASGTSGGILGYTASGVLASSIALTQYALVVGGGAGATPVPLASLGTTTTLLHGNAAGAPTFGAVAASDLGSAVAALFGQVNWGSPGSESSNTITIQATVQDAAGNTIAAATTDVEVCVSDAGTDGEPSATATIAAAGTPVGTVLSGSGTATVNMRTSAAGLFSVAVTETTPTVSRYLWVRQGRGSQCFVRANAAAQALSFA